MAVGMRETFVLQALVALPAEPLGLKSGRFLRAWPWDPPGHSQLRGGSWGVVTSYDRAYDPTSTAVSDYTG